MSRLERRLEGGARWLIVNADDFGFSLAINRGIFEAHEHGIVTSASLMVNQPGAEAAAAYARDHRALDLGLHLEFPPPRRLLRRDAEQRARAAARGQLERFRKLVGRDPTHFDSHRHRHRREPARLVSAELARDLGVPLRHFDPVVRHCPEFYGQRYGRIYSTKPDPEAIGVPGLVAVLERLEPGVTELCCHPGYSGDLPLSFRKEPYREERAVEVATLCDPEVRKAIERLGIVLCSFPEAISGRVRS